MHRRLNSLALFGAALAAALCGFSRPAGACGGFFCSTQQAVNQAAERIIFSDNGDGTVTAVIQILYQGPAEKFSWLLPISTVPEGDQLKVASDLAFTRLQAATNPQFSLNTRVEGRCREETFERNAAVADSSSAAPGANFGEAESGGVSVEARGVVGQFQWEVIRLIDPIIPDPAAPALDWLTQNGYDVTPEAAALIGPYLGEGMFLLALRLLKGSDSGSIRPIQLTYAAEAPMIPIKLTAVAANRDMGVMTWVLSDTRAVPFNYNALELNEARINWFNAASNYNQVVTDAADAAGGQGFVTEFAGASSQLARTVWLDVNETEWQFVRNRTYSSFAQMFDQLSTIYSQWNGFWDAVQRSVVLPETLSFEDFKACPNCYADEIELSPSKLFDALETDVIEPLRGVQELVDRFPYVTRLYSTLSAADMTVDPVFVFNPDLPDVNNVHTADRVIECNGNVYASQAPWRIELPQGGVVRGMPDAIGQWPTQLDAQPANFRVLTQSTAGAGRVVEDNASEIEAGLGEYNAGVPTRSPFEREDRGGFCSLDAGPRRGRVPLHAALGLGAGLALAGLRRQRRAR